MSYYENGVGERLPRHKDVTCALYQSTWSYMSEYAPITTLLTYDFEAFQHMHLNMLAKLNFGVGDEPVWLIDHTAKDTVTEKIAGGLRSKCTYNGKDFTVESMPLIVERSSRHHFGGIAVRACYEGKIRARVCGGRLIHTMSTLVTVENGFDLFKMDGNSVPSHYKIDNGIVITSDNNNFTVKATADGNADYTFDGEWGYISASEGELYILLAFTHNDTPELMPVGSARNELEKAKKHYKNIYEDWQIKTGEADIDYAFECARFHLEEAYFKPMGWSETLHHWVSFWHPEFTFAEEWGGNCQRTRDYLVYAFEHLENGDKGTDFTASGHSEMHWGGENPYLFRCVDHYLKMTADKEFAEYALPYLEKILAQTFNEYDPAQTDIMGFGCQLGNQEDFEGTPGMGSASGLEGVQMLNTMAMVYDFCEKNDSAELLEARAQRSARAVYKYLWQNDLGFFAWYEDLCGNRRLEPSYLGFCYPVVYNAVPEHDMVTNIDQMIHRLMGPEGEVYMSNHFGGHAKGGVATWGMQCGSNNQAMPAMAMARVARNNDAIRPLRFVAADVRYFGGLFPETHGEVFKTGFVASASLYSQAIIESIFGINRDLIKNTTHIIPCLPDSWENPSIKVNGAELKYVNKHGEFSVKGVIDDNTVKTVILRVKPCKKVKAYINGKKVQADITKHPGWFELALELGTAGDIDVKFTFDVIEACVPTVCAAVGDEINIKIDGARVLAVNDKCGIFAKTQTGEGFRATLKRDLLDKYEKFGWHGLINFARRRYFLTVQAEGEVFELPAVVTVLPRFAINASYADGALTVTAVSNLKVSPEKCSLLFANKLLEADINNNQAVFNFSDEQRQVLTLLTNTAKLLIGDVAYDVSFTVSEKDGCEKYQYTAVELDKAALKPATYWAQACKISTVTDSTIYCITPDNILADVLEQNGRITYGGVTFNLQDGILFADSRNDPVVTIDLSGKVASKVYLLMAAFISNQHTFSTPILMELEPQKGAEYFRGIRRLPLSFPGDLDIGLSGKGMYGFPSYVDPEHCVRGVMPPLPTLKDTDYPEAQPPEYPQHYLWNNRPAFEVNETVFTVVEIPLNRNTELKRLRITVTDDMTAVGVYGITLCKDPEQQIDKQEYSKPLMPDFS